MPQVTQRKSRTPHAVGFDNLETFQLPPVTLTASMVNTAVNGIILFPTTYKILRVMAVMTGAPAGTASINLVAGAAAEGTVGTPDTVDNGANAYPRVIAPAGTILFAADQAVTMTANTTTQIDVLPDNFDVIWKGLLTLRIATSASGAGTLTVAVLAKSTDINPARPYGSIAVGGAVADGSFTPALDLP